MIDFQNVYKSYGVQDILKDVSFRINKGEHVGIVGPNGTGKTTLFGMIVGDIEPDKGSIVTPNNIRIGYLKQQVTETCRDTELIEYVSTFIPEIAKNIQAVHEIEQEIASMSGDPQERELKLKRLGNLQSDFEAMGGYRLRTEAEKALCGLGFEEDFLRKPFSSFSGGWRMRAALAQILISNPDLLLLDEPSNYLDLPAIEWLYRFLKGYSGTLVLISHDRFLLKTLTNITFEVNNAQVTRYPGDYDYYVSERENRLKQLANAKENQDKKIEQLEASINRFRYKSSKAAQVQSWIKTIDKMELINIPDNLKYHGEIRIPEAPHSGHEIIRLEKVGLSYDGSRWILKNVDLSITKGEKIGIVGYNGTGKTTLLRMLAGRLALSEGQRILGHKVICGYQAQDFAEVFKPDCSAFDTVKLFSPEGSTAQQVRNILGAFGFSGESMDKHCSVLSGGEKIRLSFACIFVNPPNFLILDEPTTHLDIAARETLQKAIRNYNGTVCVVSHDIEFIRNAVDIIIATESHGIRRYAGNYAYYREKQEELKRAAENDSSKANNAGTENKPPENQKLRRQERAQKRQEMLKIKRVLEKEVALMEVKISELESEKQELVEKFASPSGNLDFSALNIRIHEIDTALEGLNSQWELKATELDAVNAEYEKIHE